MKATWTMNTVSLDGLYVEHRACQMPPDTNPFLVSKKLKTDPSCIVLKMTKEEYHDKFDDDIGVLYCGTKPAKGER